MSVRRPNCLVLICFILFNIWNNAGCSRHEPNMESGRTTIVHLFEWKWNDIARECEEFLGPYGYGGVQVSPPNENGILWEPFWNSAVRRPWFERYQPVSYKLVTRSGNEIQFRDMVRRCNNAGVRIYIDAIINHMTGQIGAGHGTAGSYFDPAIPKYDGVPYEAENFNSRDKCPTGSGEIENYNDKQQVRNCRLSGLLDLDLGQEYVRNKIAEYFNVLLEMGVAGFRVDAAKHMWPADLEAIYGRLNNLNPVFFPNGEKPFIYQEVIDLGGEAIKADEYTKMGRVTEFRFGKNLGDVIRKNHNQKLKYLRNFGEGWSFLSGMSALTFVDNHDNQRGHGAGGYGSILTHKQPRMYKVAVAFMLAWPYGVPRVMSSYRWTENIVNGKDLNDWIGPPSDGNWNIKDVKRNEDLTCGNGWVCEHRWRQIYNMVKFRNVVSFETVQNWWENDNNQIAFSRGNKGFLAINNEDHSMNQSLQTGLPPGSYCDIISGNKDGGRCTGRLVQVDGSGRAQIHIENSWEDPMIAIHVEVSKPLIEKRRRARINRSLSQLVEIVAKPDKVQENRSARLEKAYILEMTVEYLRKSRDSKKLPEQSLLNDYENSFQEGYRLCMGEVQNFLNKNSDKKNSEEFLKKSLQRHLCRKLQSPTSLTPRDTTQLSTELSSRSIGNDIMKKREASILLHSASRDIFPKRCKSTYSSLDSSSSTSTEDEGTLCVSESESSSSGEGLVFYESRSLAQNQQISRNELDFNPNEGSVWRPW